MISDLDRSGWIGASDVMYVVGNWKTKTFENWWMQKLGINSSRFRNEYTEAGTNWEHKILDSLGIPGLEKDRQIRIEELLLRVNLDGNTRDRIKEVKTYKFYADTGDAAKLKNGIAPRKYWSQVQVQMYASGIYGADIVAYGLEPLDYRNFLREVDRGRLREIPVLYDPGWVETVYLPKHRILADCLRRGVFPDV